MHWCNAPHRRLHQHGWPGACQAEAQALRLLAGPGGQGCGAGGCRAAVRLSGPPVAPGLPAPAVPGAGAPHACVSGRAVCCGGLAGTQGMDHRDRFRVQGVDPPESSGANECLVSERACYCRRRGLVSQPGSCCCSSCTCCGVAAVFAVPAERWTHRWPGPHLGVCCQALHRPACEHAFQSHRPYWPSAVASVPAARQFQPTRLIGSPHMSLQRKASV